MEASAKRHTAADVERILNSLKCLSCGYELRGQSGEIVRCPECGRSHNIANLVINEWRGRWYHAPGFKLLAMPLLAPIVWCVLIGAASWHFASSNRVNAMELTLWIVSITAFIGWIILITVSVSRYQRRIGLLLSLLGQLIFPVYFVGVFAMFVIGLSLFLYSDGEDPPPWVPVGALAVGIVRFVTAWLIQRLFAHLCIRVHIRKLADEGTIAV